VIRNLRSGYETNLGRWLEEGDELSMGEWQKIALARAFLRDTPIMILDEPTSALDPKAEYEIVQKFRELTVGRTSMLVSHRMSTVKIADRIHVLADGRISESGSHAELLTQNGTYARFFEMQSTYYV